MVAEGEPPPALSHKSPIVGSFVDNGNIIGTSRAITKKALAGLNAAVLMKSCSVGKLPKKEQQKVLTEKKRSQQKQ